MAEIVRAHPRHDAGIGTVPLQSPRLAIQELEHCMHQTCGACGHVNPAPSKRA